MPHTNFLPKALVPVRKIPVLEIIILQLKNYGFSEITLCVYYLGDTIKEYFGNGTKWNVNINYSEEDMPLGTAGPLKIVQNLPRHFLVLNCDILTDLDFGLFFNTHTYHDHHFTIAGFRKEFQIDYGLLHVDGKNKLIKLEEKPEVLMINSGIYAVCKDILDLIPPHITFSIDQLISCLIVNHFDISVHPFDGYWKDIGSLTEFEKVTTELELGHLLPAYAVNQR